MRQHQDICVAEMQYIERDVCWEKVLNTKSIMEGSPLFQAPGDFTHEYIFINVWKRTYFPKCYSILIWHWELKVYSSFIWIKKLFRFQLNERSRKGLYKLLRPNIDWWFIKLQLKESRALYGWHIQELSLNAPRERIEIEIQTIRIHNS